MMEECCICLCAPKSTKLIPCEHSQFCNACANTIITKYDPCPLCRNDITHYQVDSIINNANKFRNRVFAIDFALNEDHSVVLEKSEVLQNIFGIYMLSVRSPSISTTEEYERSVLTDVIRDVQNNWAEIKKYAKQHIMGELMFEMRCHNKRCKLSSTVNSRSDDTSVKVGQCVHT